MADIPNAKLGYLIASIGRLYACQADRFMERIGLYRGQAILLITLSERDGLTHTELAEILEVSPAAATKVIKRMEALHYLQRRSDPADDRISRVYLLPEGWAKIQQIKHAFKQVDQILLGDFSPEDQALLFKQLIQVHANLQNPPVERK